MDTTGWDPVTAKAVRGFAYEHLPHRLQHISKPFHDLAATMVSLLPADPELMACLRKLREAKDCAVLLAAVDDADADAGR